MSSKSILFLSVFYFVQPTICAMDMLWSCKQYVARLLQGNNQSEQVDYFAHLKLGCPAAHLQQMSIVDDYSGSCYKTAVVHALEEAFLVKVYLMSVYKRKSLDQNALWADQIDQTVIALRNKLAAHNSSLIHQQVTESVTDIQKTNDHHFKTLYQWASKDSQLSPCCSAHIKAGILQSARMWHQKSNKTSIIRMS